MAEIEWSDALARTLALRILGPRGLVLFEYPVHNGVQERRFDGVHFDPYTIREPDSPIRVLEFKSSRADFTSDQKWLEYLPYCTHFAFLAPEGAIRASELPYGVGLYHPTFDLETFEVHPYLRKAWKGRAIDGESRLRVYDRLVKRAIARLMTVEGDHLYGSDALASLESDRFPPNRSDLPQSASICRNLPQNSGKGATFPENRATAIATEHPRPASSLVDLLAPRRTYAGFNPAAAKGAS